MAKKIKRTRTAAKVKVPQTDWRFVFLAASITLLALSVFILSTKFG